MTTIIGGYSTDDAKRALERQAQRYGYRVEEWLVPGAMSGLRVACTMMVGGQKQGLGFKWSGDDLNVLATRCMALDLAMQALPEAVKRGKRAAWEMH